MELYITFTINLLLSLFLFFKANKLFIGSAFIFFIIYLLSYFIGSLFIAINNNENNIDNLKYIFIVTSYLSFFSIGVFLSKKSKTSYFITNFFYKKFIHFEKNLSKPIFNFTLIYISFPVFLIGILYFSNGIPFFSTNPEHARLRAIAGHNLNFLLLTYIFPLTIFMIYFSKIKKIIFALFIIIINFLTGFKSAIGRLLLAFLVFINIGKKLNLLQLIIFFSVGFLLLVTLVYFKFKEEGLNFAIYRIFARIFLFNPHDMFNVIELFPNKYEHLWGKAFLMDLIALKPGHDVSFDGWMYYEIYGNYTSAINSSVGGVWADFSWGYIIIIILWGYILGSFDKIIIKYKLLLHEKIIFSFLAVALGHTANSLYAKNFGFVFPLLLFILLVKYTYYLIYESIKQKNKGVYTK